MVRRSSQSCRSSIPQFSEDSLLINNNSMNPDKTTTSVVTKNSSSIETTKTITTKMCLSSRTIIFRISQFMNRSTNRNSILIVLRSSPTLMKIRFNRFGHNKTYTEKDLCSIDLSKCYCYKLSNVKNKCVN